MNAEYYGTMTMPSNAYEGRVYDLPALMNYCVNIGKSPDELSDEEKYLFEVKDIMEKTVA